MSISKNKRDLISCCIEYPKKPENIQHLLKINSSGNVVFSTYKIPDSEEFEKLASSAVKHFVDTPDFFRNLKDIIETSVKLRLLGQHIQLNIQEHNQIIQKRTLQKIQSNPFKLIMPDATTKKERLKYKKTKQRLEQNPASFVNYSMDKIDVVFESDKKANDFLAIIPNYPFILKTSLNTDKTMANILNDNADLFSDFIDVMLNMNDYCDKSDKNYTQKDWNDFIYQSWYNRTLSYIQENVVNPSMMHLIDNTRRFLSLALISEHGSEIAPTKALAAIKLKENKQEIYNLSEKYGYIENAEPFIFCENLRNQIAHPKKNVQDIVQNAIKISNLYTQLTFHYIDKNFLIDYYDKNPVLLPLDELNVQYQAYQKVRQVEVISDELEHLLPEDLKHKNSKKKISFLNKNGIITPEETEGIEELFLVRNAVAHGQSKTTRVSIQKTPDIKAIRHGLVHKQNA